MQPEQSDALAHDTSPLDHLRKRDIREGRNRSFTFSEVLCLVMGVLFTMAKNGLEEFREVVTDVKSLTSWAVNGTIVAPLADFVLNLGAPWPAGVPVITSVFELIVLICVFHFWFRKTQKSLTRRMVITLIVLCSSFFSYFYLFDSYTFVNPATSKRYAKGFIVRQEIQALIPEQVKSPEDALVGSEYMEENVWTPRSITAVRLILLAGWLMMFGSLSLFIATFVIAQRRRKIGKATEKQVLHGSVNKFLSKDEVL